MSILNQIQDAVNEAIMLAYSQRNTEFNDEAINWGDLKCYSAESWVDMNGDTGYRAHVDEADPSSWRFARYLGQHVKEKLGVDVEVVTEW